MKSRAAWRVTWCVDDSHLNAVAADRVPIRYKLIDRAAFWHGHSAPLCLYIQLIEQKEISFMDGGWCADAFLDFIDCTDVVNMRVRADELRGFQFVLFQPGKNFLRIITRVDDDRLVSLLVAKNCAVASYGSDGKRFDNHN